jgi:hypothetical protein
MAFASVCAEGGIYVAGNSWSNVCRSCGCFWPIGILAARFFHLGGCFPGGIVAVLVDVVPKRVVWWKLGIGCGVAWMMGHLRAVNLYPGYLASETCLRFWISM